MPAAPVYEAVASTADRTDCLRIVSWNVNGLRAALGKKPFLAFLREEAPDVICLQETKVSGDKDCEPDLLEGYRSYWAISKRPGYAGTAVFCKAEPVNVTYGIGDADHDQEGRTITVELKDCFIVNTYVPNSGQKLDRLGYRTEEWDPALFAYLENLQLSKPVIWTGDLNVARTEIDLANPKTNKRTAGFTIEERNSFANFLEKGFVDAFRSKYPDHVKAYSFWSYRSGARAKDVGWRLDYFIVSPAIMGRFVDSVIYKDVQGSDHAPIGLLLRRS